MKTVPVRALKSGMVLARPVMDKNREILLDAGVSITDDYIKRLKSRNIRMVSILEEDDMGMDDDFDEMEDEEDDDSSSGIQEILQDIENLNSFSFQEAYDKVKKIGSHIDNKQVVNSLLKCVLNIENEKILKSVTEILNKVEKIESDTSSLISVYGRQNDSDIKVNLLKIFKKSGINENLIKPLLYSMKNNDNYTNNEIFKTLEEYDKDAIQENCYKILSENDAALNPHIITIMKKMGISTSSSNTEKKVVKRKKVVKKEKKIDVNKAEDELLNIETKKREIDDFNKVSDNSLEQRLQSRKGVMEVSFKKIEYAEPSIELFKKEYEQSIDTTSSLIRDARSNVEIDSNAIIQIANKIVSQVVADPSSVPQLSEFNTLNNYLISHSINVAYMSVLIGYLSKMNEEELMELAIGALLHDMGMVKVGNLVWNYPKQLEFNDLFDIQKHTIYGIDTLSEISKFKGNIAYISYQHHERLDGSGYPKKKKGIQVPKYSRIVGIADVFQAMTSSRVYRGGYDLNFVFNTLMKKDKLKYDQKYISSLYQFYVDNVDSELSDLGPEPKKILIVDDSPEIRLIARKLIEKDYDNVDIIIAEDGRAAIDQLNANSGSIDLILLDIMMPVMDGFGVLDEMRLHNMTCPVIMLTAKREQSSVIRALKTGLVRDYIVKPFEKELIIEKVGKFV